MFRLLVISLIICNMCWSDESGIVFDPPLKIDGAKVETQGEAEQLSVKYYRDRLGFLAAVNGSAYSASIVHMGIDIPGFTKKGDKQWEIRIGDRGFLLAILWINPDTAEVFAVWGPWDKRGLTEPDKQSDKDVRTE